MTHLFLEAALDRLFERSDIGRNHGDLYLTRWSLFRSRFARGHHLFLHHFLCSDRDTYHDHPWPFTSLILSGGYWEHTPVPMPLCVHGGHCSSHYDYPGQCAVCGQTLRMDRRVWYPPGSLLRRHAHHAHWIEVPSTNTWSLVWTGAKIRHWGFHCPNGWLPWRAFEQNLDLNLPGCG